MSKTYLTNEGAYSNSHMELRFSGNNNIIQMINRSEKKDKGGFNEPKSIEVPAMGQTIIKENPFSSLYEKPYEIPFSQRSPQLFERHERPNIHDAITTSATPFRGTQSYNIGDGVDVAPQLRGFADSYGPTPDDLDTTTILPYEIPTAFPVDEETPIKQKEKSLSNIKEHNPSSSHKFMEGKGKGVDSPAGKPMKDTAKFYDPLPEQPHPPEEETNRITEKNDESMFNIQNIADIYVKRNSKRPNDNKLSRIVVEDVDGNKKELKLNKKEHQAIYERFFKRKYNGKEDAINYIETDRYKDKA